LPFYYWAGFVPTNQNFPIDENILIQIFSNDNKNFFSFEGITPWTGFKFFTLLG
jgi:hypothetical protein